MTQEQSLVKDFMQKFEQETPNKPCIPSYEIRKLRAELILEEALETIGALGFEVNVTRSGPIIIKHNQPEIITLENIADGLGDLHYVGYCGTAIACGLDMEPIFENIHGSNMTKLWTREELKEKGYLAMAHACILCKKSPLNCHCDDFKALAKNRFLVKNISGKVLKSPSYLPVNIKGLI